MKKLGLTVAFLAFAACGETDDNSLGMQVVGLVSGFGQEAPAQPVASVTEEQLLASSGQFLRVNVRDLNRWDTMVQAGNNGSRVTWIDSANISLTLEDGVVVATRGLQRDLMGADVQETARAIRNGGGDAVRKHDFLTDQDQIQTFVLQCSIEAKGSDEVRRLGQTIPVTRLEERCTSGGLSLTNIYWVNRAGVKVRSLQAISPDAGYLQIDAF